MVQLDPLALTLGTNVSSLLTHSELLTSAPAGSSRRTGGTGEEKEEEEEEKVPACWLHCGAGRPGSPRAGHAILRIRSHSYNT